MSDKRSRRTSLSEKRLTSEHHFAVLVVATAAMFHNLMFHLSLKGRAALYLLSLVLFVFEMHQVGILIPFARIGWRGLQCTYSLAKELMVWALWSTGLLRDAHLGTVPRCVSEELAQDIFPQKEQQKGFYLPQYEQNTERRWVYSTPQTPESPPPLRFAASSANTYQTISGFGPDSFVKPARDEGSDEKIFVEGTPPHDLSGWGKRKLHSLKPKLIEDECRKRGLTPTRDTASNVDLLHRWKKKNNNKNVTEGSSGKKRGRDDVDLADVPYGLEDWDEERLSSLSVKLLIQLCEDRNVPKSGTRPKLVSRLMKWKGNGQMWKRSKL